MSEAAPGPDPEFRAIVARLLDAAPAALTFTALAGGVSSDIWRVDRGADSFCAKRALQRLKVAAHWEAPVSRNAEEVRWLRTTRAWVGERVGEVVAHDEATGVAILRWYDPGRWRNWKNELMAGRVDIRVARTLGDTLGTIAREAARSEDLAARFDNAELFEALRIDPFFRHIRDRYPALDPLIEQLETDRTTLVHGDFSPKNVLADATGDIRILDAECATWGSAGFDPAYLLAHLLLKYTLCADPALVEAAAAFWAAYRSAVADSIDDLDIRTFRPLVGMLLARVDGKSPVEYLPADRQQSVRTAAAGLLAQAPLPITDLLDFWSSKYRKQA